MAKSGDAGKKAPRGRPRGARGAQSSARDGRRQRIAAGVAAGDSIAKIAKKEKVSRCWASREANAPETRLLIDRLLDARAAKVETLLDKSLAVIKDALTATGPMGRTDHVTRLLAVRRVMELARAGRATHEEPQTSATVTYQQFIQIYQQQRSAA